MKKTYLLILLSFITLSTFAQRAEEARKVLDKTASIVGNRGGATANFSISGTKISSASGTISIKGNKFYAHTGDATVWYNGKTQWTYLKSINEVNVTTPTEAQRMRMNPYTFITMYKNGYALSMTQKGTNYQVHMVAQNKQRSVQEVFLTIDSRSYKPSTIKMREGQKWMTISISNFRTGKLSNELFVFKAKDFPSAEVIDLR